MARHVTPVMIRVKRTKNSPLYYLAQEGEAFRRVKQLRDLIWQVLSDDRVLSCKKAHWWRQTRAFEIGVAGDGTSTRRRMEKRHAKMIQGKEVYLERVEIIDRNIVIWVDLEKHSSRDANVAGTTSDCCYVVLALVIGTNLNKTCVGQTQSLGEKIVDTLHSFLSTNPLGGLIGFLEEIQLQPSQSQELELATVFCR